MERNCELCSKSARMYCESDEARLCWDCDEKVHSANFLVAKHSRSLLCRVCQSPTPWKASGTKLSPTVSVCESCFDNTQNPTTTTCRMRIGRRPREEEEEEEEGDSHETDRDSESSAGSTDEEDEEEQEYSSDEEEEEEEDGENQVVPWASCPSPSDSSAPPLTTSSSSNSEQGSFSTRHDFLKRSRASPVQDSDDEDACCSSQANSNTAAVENTKIASFRAAKMARVEQHPEWKRRRMVLLGSLMSIQETTVAGGGGGHNSNASEVIRRISELSRDAD